jgi:hypothetical protein
MSSARERVAGFWDEHVGAWLAGEDPMADPLPRWFASFQGRGAGTVTREGFPEPYAGDLLGRVGAPRLVVLGLNPGVYHPRFQARDGIFADEIRQHGSYSAWMATGPYFRAPWTTEIGPNRYYLSRLSFARRWLDDPTATQADLLIFEAYPWHSTAVTAPMRPPPTSLTPSCGSRSRSYPPGRYSRSGSHGTTWSAGSAYRGRTCWEPAAAITARRCAAEWYTFTPCPLDSG